ncbi:MAG: YgjP-like metallopeptidase domain-containing protein, partial [Parvularcula sp.]|nr:YgjP-like metallopeptidase domain-containing protein [Parvularcula sp.]
MIDSLSVPGRDGLTVALKPSARARRMTLRVARVDGRVVLTLPRGTPVAEARAFVAKQAAWIARHVAAAPAARRAAPGGTLPVA